MKKKTKVMIDECKLVTRRDRWRTKILDRRFLRRNFFFIFVINEFISKVYEISFCKMRGENYEDLVRAGLYKRVATSLIEDQPR